MSEQQTKNGALADAGDKLPVAAPASDVAAAEPARESAAHPTAPAWLQPLQIRIEELSILTALSVRTLKRMTALGEIPGVTKIGRARRYHRATIEQWIADGCPKPGRRRNHRYGQGGRG